MSDKELDSQITQIMQISAWYQQIYCLQYMIDGSIFCNIHPLLRNDL